MNYKPNAKVAILSHDFYSISVKYKTVILQVYGEACSIRICIDYLPANIIVKKMFGMHYIYLAKRIMFILRKQDNQPELNGIWVATSKEHHPSLKRDIPESGSFFINKDERHGNWLFLSGDTDDFEEPAIKVCEMISHGDPRIGNLTGKAPI